MARKPAPKTKAHAARIIYKRMAKAGKPRKDILTAFVDKAGLTPEGAKTYYYNFSKVAE